MSGYNNIDRMLFVATSFGDNTERGLRVRCKSLCFEFTNVITGAQFGRVGFLEFLIKFHQAIGVCLSIVLHAPAQVLCSAAVSRHSICGGRCDESTCKLYSQFTFRFRNALDFPGGIGQS